MIEEKKCTVIRKKAEGKFASLKKEEISDGKTFNMHG